VYSVSIPFAIIRADSRATSAGGFLGPNNVPERRSNIRLAKDETAGEEAARHHPRTGEQCRSSHFAVDQFQQSSRHWQNCRPVQQPSKHSGELSIRHRTR
jgi:hypothetical protein